jgi:hypothetical protein
MFSTRTTVSRVSLGCVEPPLAAAAKVRPFAPTRTLVAIEN